MRGRALLAIAVVAGLLAPAAGAAERQVSAKARHFVPHRVIALTGETVRWTNGDTFDNHTLNPWDLSPFTPGTSKTRLFDTPGVFQYNCTIHAGMTGTVVVSNLYVTGPVGVLAYGKPATFSGYATEGSTVDINLVGGAANPIVSVPADGTTGKFTASIPALPGKYQAVAGARSSPLLRVNVKPRLNVKTGKKNGKYTITVSTSPNQAGGKIVLDRKSGSKWKAMSTHTLGAASKTAFTVKPTATIKVRLRLSVPKNGYSTTISGTLTLRK